MVCFEAFFDATQRLDTMPEDVFPGMQKYPHHTTQDTRKQYLTPSCHSLKIQEGAKKGLDPEKNRIGKAFPLSLYRLIQFPP
jgi:hypothetical protein